MWMSALSIESPPRFNPYPHTAGLPFYLQSDTFERTSNYFHTPFFIQSQDRASRTSRFTLRDGSARPAAQLRLSGDRAMVMRSRRIYLTIPAFHSYEGRAATAVKLQRRPWSSRLREGQASVVGPANCLATRYGRSRIQSQRCSLASSSLRPNCPVCGPTEGAEPRGAQAGPWWPGGADRGPGGLLSPSGRSVVESRSQRSGAIAIYVTRKLGFGQPSGSSGRLTPRTEPPQRWAHAGS